MKSGFNHQRLLLVFAVAITSALLIVLVPLVFLINIWLIGLLGAVSSTHEDPSAPQLQLATPSQLEDVWVAAKILEKGTKLDNIEKQLKKNRYPEEEVPSIAITNLERLRNRTLTQRVDVDQFFTEEDFE